MKLSGHIYDTIAWKKDNNHIEVTIGLNADCDIYRGHFPANPITPGVVMIGIAREIIENEITKPLQLISVPSIKYTNVLSPTASPIVTYSIDIQNFDDDIKAKVTVKNDIDVFSRMTIILSKSTI